MSDIFNKIENNKCLSYLFDVHPLWNYKYYFILEFDSAIITTICVGIKKVEVQSKVDNKYYSITDDNIRKEIILDNSGFNVKFIDCLTHDVNFNKFNSKMQDNIVADKFKILLLQTKEYNSNYEERLEEYGNRIKEVKQSWILKQSKILGYNIKGFDSITNEIKINYIEVKTDIIKFLELTNELTYKNVYNAVSKIY